MKYSVSIKFQKMDFETVSEISIECRYCLMENEEGLIVPCKCNSYVHKNCLITWFNQKFNQRFTIMNVPKFSCEICKHDYEIEYEVKNENKTLFYKELIKTYGNIICFLICSYLFFGSIAYASEIKNWYLLSYFGDQGIFTLIWCGFVITHVILGILYTSMAIMSAIRGTSCFVVYIPDSNNGECRALCVFCFFVGILLLIFTIFLEGWYYTKRKYDYKNMIIKDIKECKENKLNSNLEIL